MSGKMTRERIKPEFEEDRQKQERYSSASFSWQAGNKLWEAEVLPVMSSDPVGPPADLNHDFRSRQT